MMAQPVRFYTPLGLLDRLITVIAWGIGVALFVTVGWRALQPVDPQGAVSLLTSRQSWLMVGQTAALGVVVAALATLLVGRKLADTGIFATCLGLAFANLRANTLESLLISAADGGTPKPAELAAGFMAESLVWFGLVLLAALASGLVFRWCFGGGSPEAPSALSAMMVSEVPSLSRVFGKGTGTDGATPLRVGLGHLVLTTVLAFGLIGILSTGTPAPVIRHGQVYFSIVAAFLIAGYFAHGRFPIRTVFWAFLAVPLVTAGAYLWAVLADSGKAGALPPNIPHSAYLRALPIEYITLGTIGCLLVFWWTRHTYVTHQPHAASPRQSGK